MFAVTILVMVLNVDRWRELLNPPTATLATIALFTGLATTFIFYVGSYNSEDYYGWIKRGFPRAFFPTAFLIIPFVFSLLIDRERSTPQ
jgi:hypothetical protein